MVPTCLFETVVVGALLLALFFQVLHLLLLAGAGAQTPLVGTPTEKKIPVSVVICARNEAAQLAGRLPSILQQNYHNGETPAFEVLLADDASTDGTAQVVAGLQKRFGHLRYLFVSPSEKLFWGKKGALVKAVEHSQHAVLLFTDADCIPASPHWISKMAGALSASKDLVAGYGPYEKTSGFLNAFIRSEALLGFLQIAAFYRLGVHYGAAGRNLCVRKSVFEWAAQQPLWSKTLSGDDDMLVRLAANRTNFAVQPCRQAAVHSGAKKDLKSYIAQKQRHMSTGKYYRPGVKVILFLLNGSSFLMWAVVPFALYLLLAGGASFLLKGALVGVALRIFAFALLLYRGACRQGTKIPFAFMPLFDAGTALHSLFFAPYIFWKNKTTWK